MDWTGMFFQGWGDIVHILIVGVLAYLSLVLMLRLSGKRTLAKLNAFDLVVTVALGSILASTMVQESVSLSEGIGALGLLILAQFLVTYTSVRWQAFADVVRSEPTLLVRNGRFCDAAMRRERVTRNEALSAIRAQGEQDVAAVVALIRESDGAMSVTPRERAGT
jgi:uncharacterized membrane protein YcaP (DUF421 family)